MRSKLLQTVKETFYLSLPLAFGFVLGAAITVSEPAVTVLGVSVAETHEKKRRCFTPPLFLRLFYFKSIRHALIIVC